MAAAGDNDQRPVRPDLEKLPTVWQKIGRKDDYYLAKFWAFFDDTNLLLNNFSLMYYVKYWTNRLAFGHTVFGQIFNKPSGHLFTLYMVKFWTSHLVTLTRISIFHFPPNFGPFSIPIPGKWDERMWISFHFGPIRSISIKIRRQFVAFKVGLFWQVIFRKFKIPKLARPLQGHGSW